MNEPERERLLLKLKREDERDGGVTIVGEGVGERREKGGGTDQHCYNGVEGSRFGELTSHKGT